METYRLKNIAIVILLLLNGFLLLLLGIQFYQSRQSATDAAAQLRELYGAKGLALSEEIDLEQQPLSPLALTRRQDTEQAIAAYLLGADPVTASQGGGIVSYATEAGSVQFRSGGSFDGGRLARPVDDPDAFVRDFCAQFGYEDVSSAGGDGSLTFTAAQRADGVAVEDCLVRLQFEGSVLTAVTGAHISLEDAVPEAAEQMTCVTALVRFLDYREANSAVCSRVTGVSCVYARQGGGSLRLLPVWQVETDTYTYFVDCASGEVTREQ